MSSSLSFPRTVALLAGIVVAAAAVRADTDAMSASESKLLAVLRSDAPKSEKAITCKKLAIEGSSESVPELAKLLPDPQLSSWARIALEAIPGDAADAALRDAMSNLEGRLQVGVINSIGIRHDQDAVNGLTERVQDEDPAVASAAAVALGSIGGVDAAKSLQASLADAPNEVRSAIAEGCVLVAERFAADGDSDRAIELYDLVRQADVPGQRVLEATRGAILARGQDGIPLLMEQFRSPDKRMFQLALGTVREFPGGEVDKALVQELADASPRRAALMIQAMADRPQTVVLTAILKSARQGDPQVRLSAIDALRRVGNESCLADLLAIAIESDGDLAQQARATLGELPGESVDEKIVAMLPERDGKSFPLLLELVGQRRIDAVSELLDALEHHDGRVRSAALVALGETVDFDRLSVLVSQVVSPEHPEDAPVVQRALRVASVRMPDREACAELLGEALQQASATGKETLMEVLSDIGGAGALQTLAMAARSDDPQQQDTGSRLLGKWNGVDAAPVLLDLAKTAPAEKFQIRALRGYISLARRFAMPEPQRAEMCRKALEAASRQAERDLVFDVLELHPSVAALKLAIEAEKDPATREAASQAARVIAQKLSSKGVDVSPWISKAALQR